MRQSHTEWPFLKDRAGLATWMRGPKRCQETLVLGPKPSTQGPSPRAWFIEKVRQSRAKLHLFEETLINAPMLANEAQSVTCQQQVEH